MIGLALNDEECRMVQKASRQGGKRATERLNLANLVSFCCPSAIAIRICIKHPGSVRIRETSMSMSMTSRVIERRELSKKSADKLLFVK